MNPTNLLFVDDDADDRNLIQEFLEAQNYHAALFFEDAFSVLKYLNSLQEDAALPHTIITDVNMPKMSGIDLLRELKENKRYQIIKVVMLSTANQEDYWNECERLGALQFFQKPSTYTDMKQMISYFTLMY